MVKQILVSYGIDVDAVSNWINTGNGESINATKVSRGVFGGTIGMERVLELLDKNNIKATLFTPAHSLKTFPDVLERAKLAGHEFGLHGYTHETFSQMDLQQHRDVMSKSIQAIEEFTGVRPVGFTAPSWETNEHTVKVLEEFGIKYDHSFMYHDCQLHYLPYSDIDFAPTNYKVSAGSWMQPMRALKMSKVVEIPANWYLDDWPPMNIVVRGTGFSDPYSIEQIWKDQFTYFYETYESFVFPMTIHPDVSGKGHLTRFHQAMIDFINSHEGVRWVTMSEMADEFLTGKFAGVDIKAGVS
jgi:peptidoglycan/xylan/chitin deacetylase (PgdA/CDA1 family)